MDADSETKTAQASGEGDVWGPMVLWTVTGEVGERKDGERLQDSR